MHTWCVYIPKRIWFQFNSICVLEKRWESYLEWQTFVSLIIDAGTWLEYFHQSRTTFVKCFCYFYPDLFVFKIFLVCFPALHRQARLSLCSFFALNETSFRESTKVSLCFFGYNGWLNSKLIRVSKTNHELVTCTRMDCPPLPWLLVWRTPPPLIKECNKCGHVCVWNTFCSGLDCSTDTNNQHEGEGGERRRSIFEDTSLPWHELCSIESIICNYSFLSNFKKCSLTH